MKAHSTFTEMNSAGSSFAFLGLPIRTLTAIL
jgi:hypothetical protein